MGRIRFRFLNFEIRSLESGSKEILFSIHIQKLKIFPNKRKMAFEERKEVATTAKQKGLLHRGRILFNRKG
ncbi:hypothetical protein CH380_01510 [Leptospira adleri]|uniref:Uncharacterized protein n=1 Tax=Leptospira adleri TaxID=2023186 RepID=A0A2M9YUJ5_9LEPT|nr:hypothetical protein CH380_01510 [Leptospira adleri]PJZ63405.1 hypothetical protein CH376_02915 [Leptospira adleri]